MARELDNRPLLTFALCIRGVTAQSAGDLDLSRQRLEEAVALARATSAMLWDSLGTAVLASVRHEQGDIAHATALVEQAYSTARAGGVAWTTALTLYIRGFFAAEKGDVVRAAELYRESLRLTSAMGERRFFASALAGYAWVLALQGDIEGGTRLCGAVDDILDVTGVNLTRTGHLGYDRALALARQGMDEPTVEGAREAGRAMQPQEVLAEVNCDPGVRTGGSQRTVSPASR